MVVIIDDKRYSNIEIASTSLEIDRIYIETVEINKPSLKFLANLRSLMSIYKIIVVDFFYKNYVYDYRKLFN